eukprot:505050-Pelagomonas_calceolata.AAC.1
MDLMLQDWVLVSWTICTTRPSTWTGRGEGSGGQDTLPHDPLLACKSLWDLETPLNLLSKIPGLQRCSEVRRAPVLPGA